MEGGPEDINSLIINTMSEENTAPGTLEIGGVETPVVTDTPAVENKENA